MIFSPRFLLPPLLAVLAGAPLHAQDENLQRALAGADLVASTLATKARDFIEVTGNTSFKEDELLAAVAEQVREIQDQGLTPARADDTAFYVGTYYRKAGFSQVTVDYEIRGKKLVLKIKEGPRSLLRKIHFTGNPSIPEATLFDYMIGATPERLEKEPEQFPFTAAEVAAGGDRVRGLYLSEGYLNVKVDTSGVQLSPDGLRAEVTVGIVEGTRYTYGAIHFEGQTLFPESELRTALGVPAEGPYSPGKTNLMQRNLQSFFKGRGYFQAEVAVTADPLLASEGRVPVAFIVTPHELFRFGGVSVKNEGPAPRLNPTFLPTRFALLKGEVYDPEKLDETFREMLRTGLFTTLRVTTVAQPTHEVALEITAEEAKAKELGFTLGYGSYEGVTVGVRLGDRDLFGHGRPLTFGLDYSQRGFRGELLYVDPWWFESHYALRARLFSASRDEEGYSKNEFGARVDLSRRVLPHLEVGVFVEESKVKVTDAETNDTLDVTRLGPTDYLLTSVGFTQLTDFRDSPTNPARGFVLSSSFDYALLDSTPAFTRSTLRLSYYLPLGKCLLALGGRGGYIAPIIDSIPIDVRFFNGGGTSVRSFAERELGPQDKNGNPLGGDVFTVLNAELMFPLYGALQGAAFVDAGSLDNRDVDTDESDLRYAVGLGLRYKLPIGPLRLDYGVNPSPKNDEAFGAFHFSFGFAF